MLRLAVRHDPDVRGDPGVVEELGREGDDGLQPVVFDDPPADLALPRAGVPGEERGPVEDDGDAAASLRTTLWVFHLRDHVLQEEQCSVRRAGRAGREPPVRVAGLVLDVALLLLPRHPEGWIRQHEVEPRPPELILRKRRPEPDVARVLARHQEVRLGDGVRLVVDLLPEHEHVHVRLGLLDVLLRNRQHPPGSEMRSQMGQRPRLSRFEVRRMGVTLAMGHERYLV